MEERANILIIDDEKVIIDSIAKIVDLEGYSYDYALDFQSALEKIFSNYYNLIICDIMLPARDGFQILYELESKRIETPVIITTGYSTIENAVKSLYLGAIDYIPKPFSIDEMISVIKRGMRYSEMICQKKKNKNNLLLVPCPAKYYRLGYSCWMNKEHDGSVILGATDFFIKTIEPILNIELMNVTDTLAQAMPSVKFSTKDGLAHQMFAAISGKIIARNEKLIGNSELIEKDPYFEGWIYKIIPSELEYEMKQLIPCSSDR